MRTSTGQTGQATGERFASKSPPSGAPRPDARRLRFRPCRGPGHFIGRGKIGDYDFGAAGTSGAAVTGAPASSSGATKLTSRVRSFPARPARGSNSYDV